MLIMGALLFLASANAATISVSGVNVKFTYDDSTLYGSGAVIGDTIFFTPSNFKAESLNGAGLIQTSDSLEITIETITSYRINEFQLLEDGDYEINGSGASVSVDSILTIDSVTSAYSDSQAFNASALTTQGALTAWSAGASINLGDTPGWNSDTMVFMTLGNTLSAETLNFGESAFIEKKFKGTAIGITALVAPPAPTVVPVPAAALLFGSALGILGWLRRKTF
jgi:hypothetical protein